VNLLGEFSFGLVGLDGFFMLKKYHDSHKSDVQRDLIY
jgi:hypothetical protein